MKQIAEKTGYSVNTVSCALRDKPEIPESTRLLIQEKAKNMSYIANSTARALQSGESLTIAIIIGDISNPNLSIIVKELEISARFHGYNAIIINTEEDPDIENLAVLNVLSRNVDGIVMMPCQKEIGIILTLKKAEIPFVLIGRHFPQIPTDFVTGDDEKGAFLAVSHLIERGHSRILFLNGPAYISNAVMRLKGYQKAFSDKGYPLIDDLVLETDIMVGKTAEVIHKVEEQGIQYTAIFAFSDLIAFEAICTLQEIGKKIPEDISIIGFDNIQSKIPIPFGITSVGASKTKMAQRSIEILLSKMKDQTIEKLTQEFLEPTLIIRESTR